MLVMERDAFPWLVREMTIGIEVVVPASSLKKFTDDGERETGIIPVPESDTLSGLVGAFVVNVRLALLAPVAEGRNDTATEQLLPAPREAPQELDVTLKSELFVPVMAMLEMVRLDPPVFVRMTF